MLGCGCRLGVRTGAVDRRTPEAGGGIGGGERLFIGRLGALHRRAISGSQDKRRLPIPQPRSRLRRRGKRGRVRGCCRGWWEKVRVRGEECINSGIASELHGQSGKVQIWLCMMLLWQLHVSAGTSSRFLTRLSNSRRGNSSAPVRPISCRSCLRSGQRYGYGLLLRHCARGRLRAREHRGRDRRWKAKQVSQ